MALLNQLHSMLAWMGWYVVPFVAILSAIVFYPRTRALSGRALERREDRHVFPRLRPGTLRLGRRRGHALARRRPSSWRICQILRRRQRRQRRPGRRGERRRADRSRPDARRPAARQAGADRRRRAGRQLHPRLRHLHRDVHGLRQGRTRRRTSGGSSRTASRRAAGFEVGDIVKSVNGEPIDSFEALQQATMLSTGLPMRFVVERAGADVAIEATPEIAVVDQGVFGKRRMGHLGLGSSTDPADVQFARCSATTCALWGGQQVWFIVRATSSYIVGMIAGRESADQVSGPIAVAQMAGEMAKISLWELFNLAALFSVSVGFMNLLAGSASRRRTPAVLRLRGGARPAVEPAGAGDRPARRHRLGRAADHCSPPRTTSSGSSPAAINP